MKFKDGKKKKVVCVCVIIIYLVVITEEVRVSNEEPGSLTLYRLDLAKFNSDGSIFQII